MKARKIVSLLIAVAMFFTVVSVMPQIMTAANTYPTPDGYNANDYQKLVAFALQDDNLEKLGWNLSTPGNWLNSTKGSSVAWVGGRVAAIGFTNHKLTGKLDVSGFTALESLQCNVNYLTGIDLTNCSSLKNLDIGFNWFSDVEALKQIDKIFNEYGKLETANVHFNLFDMNDSVVSDLLGMIKYYGFALPQSQPYPDLKLSKGEDSGDMLHGLEKNIKSGKMGFSAYIYIEDPETEGYFRFIDKAGKTFDVAFNLKDLGNASWAKDVGGFNSCTRLPDGLFSFMLEKEDTYFEDSFSVEIYCTKGEFKVRMLHVNERVPEDEGKGLVITFVDGYKPGGEVQPPATTDSNAVSSDSPLSTTTTPSSTTSPTGITTSPTAATTKSDAATTSSGFTTTPLGSGSSNATYTTSIYSPNSAATTSPVATTTSSAITTTPTATTTTPPATTTKQSENATEPPKTEIHFDYDNKFDEIIEGALKEDNPRIVLDDETGSVISEVALDAIRRAGKVVEIELENGIVISIDPAKITDKAKPIDLNMDVIFVSNGTQLKKDNEVTGVQVGANSVVITPAAHGEFGFEIAFTITAAQLKANRLNANNVKIFYVDAQGNIKQGGTITVNNDGSVTVKLTHASYYVLSEATPVQLGSKTNNNNKVDGNAKTAVTLCVVPAIIAGSAAVISRKRKK